MLKRILRLLLITGLLLLIPVLASQYVDGWDWSFSDYVFAGIMFFGTGALFEWGRSISANMFYRAGFGLALLAGFMITWANLAVGFIGSEENPANLMYFAVLAVTFLASIILRFNAQGMSRIMFATALALFLIPVIALVVLHSDFAEIPQAAGTLAVFVLNGFLVLLFVGSGLLFGQASNGIQDQA
ncbi:MAG: hypothetical protein KW793_03355 [Candidatus Doudnabacteria bacterium]|nr:hypothetical protein [Candidatus Doudnabacteria bacterium]